LSPWELQAFHPYTFLPPLGNSQVIPKELRIKECAHGFLGNNIKILFQA
jgi:hypothetical protein